MDKQKKLINWDFQSESLNSSASLINRQKSALNVSVININQLGNSGIFKDKKNGTVNTSLENCECKDFNFVGNAPRKKFMPCMHIYRLAFELDIIRPKHIDSKTKLALMSLDERKKVEIERLHQFEKDPSQWGEWHERIHKSSDQRNRQYNAYYLLESVNDSEYFLQQYKEGAIHGYNVTLSSCTCPDFRERQLPCKHIYCLALLNNINLPVTEVDFKKREEYLNR